MHRFKYIDNSLVELTLVVETCTMMSYDAWLLRTIIGCAGPLFSLTLNVDLSKVTEASNIKHRSCT